MTRGARLAACHDHFVGTERRLRILRRVILACVLVTLGGCSDSSAPKQDATQSLQSPTSPSQTARAYLAAAKPGDCQLTNALTLPSTRSWCTHPKLLDYR